MSNKGLGNAGREGDNPQRCPCVHYTHPHRNTSAFSDHPIPNPMPSQQLHVLPSHVDCYPFEDWRVGYRSSHEVQA